MSYDPIPVDADGNVTDSIKSVTSIVDLSNSTTVLLGANSTFTGVATVALNYNQIQVFAFSDQPSAVNGLQIQFSTDGVNWDHVHEISYEPTPNGDAFQAHVHTKYYRVVYINGTTPQGIFRLQTLLRPITGIGTVVEADDIVQGDDDCVLVKAILTGNVEGTSTYVDMKTTSDGGLVINQDIQVDSQNSSTANLSSLVTFTGVGTSNLNATAIQVFLHTDQNCTVFVDQSQDGVNWDITDSYNYYSSLNNFAVTVNAVGAWYRTRVINVSPNSTTAFRLQSILVPILSALPRSLSQDGWLQTAINHIQDDTGFSEYYTPFGEQVSVPLYRLLGGAFNGNTLDTNFWNPSVGTGGTVAPVNGLLTIATGTVANNSTSIVSTESARFISGAPNKLRHVMILPDVGTVNNLRRWGAYNANDGAFFQLNGTTFSIGTRKAGVTSLINNGSFNGRLGNTLTVDTALPHSYEIVLNSFRIWFYYDKKLLHTFTPTSSWSAILDFPLMMENINSGGSTSNVAMYVFASQILRTGLPSSQPVSNYISGATAGTTLKLGSGNLHGLVVGANTGAITIYDNTTATGSIITSITANTTGSIDLKGIVFSVGLTVVTTGGGKWTLLYE